MMDAVSQTDEQESSRRGLLFAWSEGGSLVAHLGVFVAVSAGIHFFGFYLFQVVYPVTARVEPVPSRVRLLDSSQPAVSALMRQIEDRLVFLRPASAGMGARVTLADHSAEFRPSFGDRGLGLRPFSVAPSTAPGGDGFDMVLPPVNREVLSETTMRAWRLGGDLAGRPVRKPDLLDKALAEFDFRSGESVRLSLAIDRQGDLRSVLPTGGEDYSRIGELVTAVRAHLRFERDSRPAAASGGGEAAWQRGWLEIGR